MLNLRFNKKAFENVIKNKKIFKNIRSKLYCNTCGGKGYIYVEKDKCKICHRCSGVGIISYSYF